MASAPLELFSKVDCMRFSTPTKVNFLSSIFIIRMEQFETEYNTEKLWEKNSFYPTGIFRVKLSFAKIFSAHK